jgi:hypothetical protein
VAAEHRDRPIATVVIRVRPTGYHDEGAGEAMADNTSTVPVAATDLRVGDVIRWPDGRYFAVNTKPEPNHHPEEYSAPRIAVWVTKINQDMTPVANSAEQVLSRDTVLEVLTPRPEI